MFFDVHTHSVCLRLIKANALRRYYYGYTSVLVSNSLVLYSTTMPRSFLLKYIHYIRLKSGIRI